MSKHPFGFSKHKSKGNSCFSWCVLDLYFYRLNWNCICNRHMRNGKKKRKDFFSFSQVVLLWYVNWTVYIRVLLVIFIHDCMFFGIIAVVHHLLQCCLHGRFCNWVLVCEQTIKILCQLTWWRAMFLVTTNGNIRFQMITILLVTQSMK